MKIILIGNGSPLNRGCEAILCGTLTILARVFPEATIENYYFSRNKRAEVDLLKRSMNQGKIHHIALPNIPSAIRFSTRWFLSKIGRRFGPHTMGYLAYRNFQDILASQIDTADFALQLGGDNYSLDYGFPLLHSSIDQTLASKGVPVALWGASVGPFSAIPGAEKWMLNHFKKYTRLILAREPDSLEYLQAIGLDKETYAMADPAFVMEPSQPKTCLWNNEIPEKCIGLNLSPLIGKYRQKLTGLHSWVKDAAFLIEAIIQHFNEHLLLIPHVTIPGNDDFVFMSEVLRLVDGRFKGKVSIVPPDLNAQELKWIISKLNILIAARTHATIAGFSSSVPTISIAYSMKAYGLNKLLFGNQDYVIHASDLNAESLIPCMEKVLSQSNHVRTQLSNIIPDLQATAFEGGEILATRMLTSPQKIYR